MIPIGIIVDMGGVMNSLTYEELKEVYDGDRNLGDKPIVIYFHATWCGPCKMFSPIVESVSEEYKSKVDFYKVDSEDQPDLTYMFQVRSIPTLVMIPITGETTMSPGALNEDTLKYFIEGLIRKK